ncbi:MAG: NAD-dependent epimerase [Rickettsiales bacterium]|nr:NAD-dependent epimerase [Rickettsiales bacterium]
MTKILITGGSGFIASHVADELSKIGKTVYIFDKKKSKYLSKNQKMIIGSVGSKKLLDRSFKNKDIIYHFAATADLNEANKYPLLTIKNNIISTTKVLEACRKNNIKKIIFASSIYALSEQGGFYSTSKLASEMIIERYSQKYGFDFSILRFGTVYGERANKFNTIKQYIDQAKKEKKIFRNTKGNEIRNYIHVKDVAKICASLIRKNSKSGFYNIIGNRRIKVKQLLQKIRKNLPETKVLFKNTNRPYNYKINPFTYSLRKGKNIRLKKYINLDKGINDLISKN